MKKEILGVKIDDITLDQAVEMVESWLSNPGKHYVVTPNPEFIVAAQSDPVFKKILNDADLSIPDGVGLKLFAGIKNRVTGIDLMESLLQVAAKKGYLVGLIGGKKGVVEKAAQALRKRYSGLEISYTDSGGEVDEEGKLLMYPKGLKSLNCDLLFVGFGHGKQEKWIAKNLKNIPVRVAMGIGGSFDVLSGTVPRAPKIVRDLGFEWLFRLAVQPWRIKRQLALIKFVWMIKK